MSMLITKLPFRKLAEAKISAETREKHPLLNKAIPYANHIVFGIAAVLVAVILFGSSWDTSAGFLDNSQNILGKIKGLLNKIQDLLGKILNVMN